MTVDECPCGPHASQYSSTSTTGIRPLSVVSNTIPVSVPPTDGGAGATTTCGDGMLGAVGKVGDPLSHADRQNDKRGLCARNGGLLVAVTVVRLAEAAKPRQGVPILVALSGTYTLTS